MSSNDVIQFLLKTGSRSWSCSLTESEGEPARPGLDEDWESEDNKENGAVWAVDGKKHSLLLQRQVAEHEMLTLTESDEGE